jgi:hypothetical protein
MAETISAWIQAIIQWFTILPQNAWAVVLSVLIASLGTQAFKRMVLVEFKLGGTHSRFYTRLAAFIIGFVVCYAIWPRDVYRVWSALATALIAPVLYKVTMAYVYRRWPDLQAKFSGYLDEDA